MHVPLRIGDAQPRSLERALPVFHQRAAHRPKVGRRRPAAQAHDHSAVGKLVEENERRRIGFDPRIGHHAGKQCVARRRDVIGVGNTELQIHHARAQMRVVHDALVPQFRIRHELEDAFGRVQFHQPTIISRAPPMSFGSSSAAQAVSPSTNRCNSLSRSELSMIMIGCPDYPFYCRRRRNGHTPPVRVRREPSALRRRNTRML